MRWMAVALLVGTAGATGCGDSLVDLEHRGDPLFTFLGVSVESLPSALFGPDLRIALFWTRSGTTGSSPADVIEQVSTGVALPTPWSVPEEYHVFLPPPAEDLPEVVPFRIGRLLVYSDRDGDRRFSASADDEVVGGGYHPAYYPSFQTGLIVAARPLEPGALLSDRSVPIGFHSAFLPPGCRALAPIPDPPARQCQRGELGRQCQADDDCGDQGICLHDPEWRGFLGGYCAQEAERASCVPPSAEAIVWTRGHWIRTCLSDEECRAGYRCVQDAVDCPVCWPVDAFPPLECSDPDPEAAVIDYGVPLGNACDADDDCGDLGTCLGSGNGLPMPGGYCVIDPEKATDGRPQYGVEATLRHSLYVQACSSGADCRTGEGYRCSLFPGGRVCAPQRPIQIQAMSGSNGIPGTCSAPLE